MNYPIEETAIEIYKDRYVTPGIIVPAACLSVGLWIPALDDASIVYLDSAPFKHAYNYPRFKGDFATEGVAAEFQFDDEDGTTITDRVNGVILTEQGNPTFQASAATAGLGKGLTLDGTGDQFDALTSEIPQGAFPTTGDFAIEFVWKGTSGANGADDTLIALRNGAAGVGWALLMNAAEQLIVHMEDASGQVTMTSATDIATDAVVHIGVDFDRDGNITAYVNGAAVATAESIAANTGTVWPGIGAACRLAIGGDANRTATSVVTGTVYFARIYNRILGATGWKRSYNTLLGAAYPGWSPVYDYVNKTDLQVLASGDAPAYVDLTPYVSTLRGMALRARCAVQQTTTPADLTFGWVFS